MQPPPSTRTQVVFDFLNPTGLWSVRKLAEVALQIDTLQKQVVSKVWSFANRKLNQATSDFMAAEIYELIQLLLP